MKKNIFTTFLLTSLLVQVFPGFSFAMSEHEKIRYLLREIEVSGYTFIRNGREYSSRKAKDHLEYKLKRAGINIKTARNFIRKIASRSSFSGKPYYIRMKNGVLVKTEEWLGAKLKELEKSLKSR